MKRIAAAIRKFFTKKKNGKINVTKKEFVEAFHSGEYAKKPMGAYNIIDTDPTTLQEFNEWRQQIRNTKPPGTDLKFLSEKSIEYVRNHPVYSFWVKEGYLVERGGKFIPNFG